MTISNIEDNYLPVADGTIHYCMSGHDHGQQPIIWVHGLPLDESSWYAQKIYFDAHYRNICFDMRGYGKSSRLPQPIKNVTDIYVADLVALCEHLNLDKPIVVGFASGGHGTLRFAAQHPDRLSQLILINGSPKFMKGDNWPFGFTVEALEKTIKQIDATTSNDEIASIIFDCSMQEACTKEVAAIKKWFTSMLNDHSRETIKAFFTDIAYDDDRELIKNITVPTLILSGYLDKEVPSATAHYMRQAIPNSQLVELNGTDQFSFATQSHLVNQLIAQFIKPTCGVIIPDDV